MKVIPLVHEHHHEYSWKTYDLKLSDYHQLHPLFVISYYSFLCLLHFYDCVYVKKSVLVLYPAFPAMRMPETEMDNLCKLIIRMLKILLNSVVKVLFFSYVM